MKFLLRLLLSALAVVILSKVLPGVGVDGYLTAIIVAVVLSLLNFLVKPLLVILTLPITIITLGIFLSVYQCNHNIVGRLFHCGVFRSEYLVGTIVQPAPILFAIHLILPIKRGQEKIVLSLIYKQLKTCCTKQNVVLLPPITK